MDDIRILMMKVKDLSREVALGRGGGEKTADMSREILQLQRELLQEKTKVKFMGVDRGRGEVKGY